jgi:PAS domain S-box-containing protein
VSIGRWGTLLFLLATLTAAGTSAVDAIQRHYLSLTDLGVLSACAVMGVVLLLSALLDTNRRAATLQTRTSELGALAQKLEDSLTTVSAVNARLNESEARYKGLVDAQGDAIVRRSPDGKLTYANDAFCRLFSQSQLSLGQPFMPELHPDNPGPLLGTFSGSGTEQARVKYDQHVRTVYGWRWIAWEDYAIRNSVGRLIEIQSVGRDVTERKALEDALTKARDKAEAASRAKSDFLATMSHEIRTPMNGVLGMARLLLETEIRPEQRSYVEAIRQSGEALLTLIGDVLDFSKIESGAMTLQEDVVEPHRIANDVVDLLAPRAHGKAIELVAVIAADTPQAIRADALRLRQILVNLVGNAVKFTEKGGVRVDVSRGSGRDRQYLRFEVRDTGMGVPFEKRADIFDEFVQADSSHARKLGGSGLGLAISKRLVTAMGGEIGVTDAPGGGSVFWFTIPAFVIRGAKLSEGRRLSGQRFAIISRNVVLRESLTSQIRSLGGDVVPLAHKDSAIDGLLVDAGPGVEPDLPARPEPGVRSLVLIAPHARSWEERLKQFGFAVCLSKPLRQDSLPELLLQDNAGVEMPPIVFLPTAPQQSATAAPTPAAGQRILMAEDNPINAMLVRELLKRRGYNVCEVRCGEDALKMGERERFDLVLTDIHMPGLDGIETARHWRDRETKLGRRRTPILALTADAMETGRQACLEAGMDGFLTKPVDPAELDAMLELVFSVHERPRDAA